MASARPAINVVEKNPYTPRPFVFTEVAVSLRDAIVGAGYGSEHLQNRIDPGAFSIVIGATPGNAHEFGDLDPSRCAILNLEHLGGKSAVATPEYRRWLAQWIVLDPHSANIETIRRQNGSRQAAFEVPIVPSPALGTNAAGEKDIDVLFYGTPSSRRSHVLEELEARGLRVESVQGAYGSDLAPAMRRAKVVLHVHFGDAALFPVARVLQPVTMGVPVVCEDSVFSELNDWSHSGIVFCDYKHLADACRDLADSADRRAVRAAMAQAFVRELDFAGSFSQVMHAFESRARGETATEAAAPALSEEEIARILEQDGAELPPEEEAPAPTSVPLAQRELGKGPYGNWVTAFLIVLMLVTLINMIRG